jgi:hypothetical protein
VSIIFDDGFNALAKFGAGQILVNNFHLFTLTVLLARLLARDTSNWSHS